MDRKEYITLLNTIIDSKNREELNNNIRIANEFIRNNNLTPETTEFKKIETVVGLMKVKIKNKRKMEFESVQDETLLELKKKELISIIKESEEENYYTDKKDYTKFAQKSLELTIPNKIKYVKDLKVLNCFTAKYEHDIGGVFSYTDNIIHLDIKFYIDKQPWIDAGFVMGQKGTYEMMEKAYGKNYLSDLRNASHEVKNYLTINPIYNDWKGQITFKII